MKLTGWTDDEKYKRRIQQNKEGRIRRALEKMIEEWELEFKES